MELLNDFMKEFDWIDEGPAKMIVKWFEERDKVKGVGLIIGSKEWIKAQEWPESGTLED